MHNSLLLYCTPVLFAGFKNIFTTHGLQYMLYIEAIFLLTYFPRCLNIRELHKAFESYFNLHLKFPHSLYIPGWRQSDFFFFKFPSVFQLCILMQNISTCFGVLLDSLMQLDLLHFSLLQTADELIKTSEVL